MAPSIHARIVADLPKASERIRPLPLQLAEPDTTIAEPTLDIATPTAAYVPQTVQMPDQMAPHAEDIIIATTSPRPVPGHPNTSPLEKYPAAAHRAGQEGTVLLSLQILASGEISDAVIEKSSGYAALDQAAARHAKLHWHFFPGTRNGVPAPDWRTVAVVFALEGVTIKY